MSYSYKVLVHGDNLPAGANSIYQMDDVFTFFCIDSDGEKIVRFEAGTPEDRRLHTRHFELWSRSRERLINSIRYRIGRCVVEAGHDGTVIVAVRTGPDTLINGEIFVCNLSLSFFSGFESGLVENELKWLPDSFVVDNFFMEELEKEELVERNLVE